MHKFTRDSYKIIFVRYFEHSTTFLDGSAYHYERPKAGHKWVIRSLIFHKYLQHLNRINVLRSQEQKKNTRTPIKSASARYSTSRTTQSTSQVKW